MTRRMVGLSSVLLMLAVSVWAASVHFKPHSVELIDQGVTLLAMGSLAGLSHEDVTIVVTATGSPEAICTNKGGNAAPGQNPADVTVSGTIDVDASRIDNGQLFFSLSTVAPTLTSAQAGCPNGSWTATVTDVVFASALITVIQGGEVVLSELFSL